tara:strand:- start:9858 stop:11246 length:1389 start_codon:yes stop_codon:yes gene_type:complete
MQTRRIGASFLAFSLAFTLPTGAYALAEITDVEMSDVTGTGLAFVFDDFSMRQAPTSYIELIGSQPTTQAAAAGWQRGDPRYYGLSMTSGSTSGTDWFGNGCTGDALACPLGSGDGDFGIDAFASVYDPFVLRVFEYQGFDYQGTWRTGSSGANAMPTILEFKGPTNSDTWRWSFWGELEIGRTAGVDAIGTCNDSAAGCGAGANFLQSQTIIHGKPVVSGTTWLGLDAGGNDLGYQTGASRPAILRLMKTLNNNDPTLGVSYQSALSGDFRFSVQQTAASSDELHVVPDFDDGEGLHFRNVEAFLPLGTLHYQALTFSGVSEYGYDASDNLVKLAAPTQNGNFTIELTSIPNNSNIYNHFYCGSTSGGCALDSGGSIASPNPNTHGYVRWGNWTQINGTTPINPNGASGVGAFDLPDATSTANGIYYSDGTGASGVTNLGISRIEGMLIQHLKITTLGAGT